jgi:hypothetical protein
MTARAQWTQIEAALDEILALPESQWPEACARIAGNDELLLAEINSLLACTQGIDPVLDRPITVPDLKSCGVTELAAGTRVGAYVASVTAVLERLGTAAPMVKSRIAAAITFLNS